MSNEQRLDENNGSIDDSEFQILEQFAIRLAKESGAKLLDHFLKPIEVEYKTNININNLIYLNSIKNCSPKCLI